MRGAHLAQLVHERGLVGGGHLGAQRRRAAADVRWRELALQYDYYLAVHVLRQLGGQRRGHRPLECASDCRDDLSRSDDA